MYVSRVGAESEVLTAALSPLWAALYVGMYFVGYIRKIVKMEYEDEPASMIPPWLLLRVPT